MKKIMYGLIPFFFLVLFLNGTTFAQLNWKTTGNNNGLDAEFGTNDNFGVLFESNGVLRGKMQNDGDWGLGTTSPNCQLHVNTDVAGEDGFRVQIQGASKLFVDDGGGVSVGSSSIPPANGLYVSGNAGIGTSVPAVKLHVAGGSDSEPASGGFLVLGPTTLANLSFDDNEIMARNNGVVSTLFLQNDGGDLNVHAGDLYVDDAGHVGINTTSPGSFSAKIVESSAFGLDLVNSEENDWELHVQPSSGPDLAFYFDGFYKGELNSVDGVYIASDKQLKRNIEDISSVMDKVMQLKPSRYEYIDGNPMNKKSLGFIAQDIQQLFPELVDEGGRDGELLALNYDGFGVIAIKAIQELHETVVEKDLKIAELESRLSALENAVASLTGTEKTEQKSAPAKAASYLEQNAPNPFSENTTIRYHIAENANAWIVVTDAMGNVIQNEKADESGQISFKGYELNAGTYTYSLIVDGKRIDTRQMVLVK